MMANPWTKKNPLLSLWLSAANTWAGAARGAMTAAARREVARATKAPSRPRAKRRKA
jgi:hypothetical protein